MVRLAACSPTSLGFTPFKGKLEALGADVVAVAIFALGAVFATLVGQFLELLFQSEKIHKL